MKCAVLGNGPCRVAFSNEMVYDWKIGCNIPWTTVDATVIVDTRVIDAWGAQPNLIECPTYFSKTAWLRTSANRKRSVFEPWLVEIFEQTRPYYSSGHYAALFAIRKGCTELDIFGADAVFTEDLSSFTHKYADSSHHQDRKQITGWRLEWKRIQDSYPNVQMKFIYSPSEFLTRL